jgi:hypothetical protein
MAMAEQDVLDVGRIESERDEAGQHDAFDVAGMARVEQHDAVGGRDRVNDRFGIADGVEVVEEFHRGQRWRRKVVGARVAGNAEEVEGR